jgi:hypothetical protein
VSLFKEPSPPATPEATSEPIEVLGESGNLIGRLDASDTGNSVMDQILELPVKRPVQIRAGRKFTAEDLAAVPRPYPGDARPFKFLSFFVQATGELQERPCQDCALNYGPYQGCVVVHGPDFERCGNCEWNKRRCHSSTTERRPSSRHSLSGKSATKSPTKVRASGGSFAAANIASASQNGEQAGTTANVGGAGGKETTKKAPRKSLPGSRRPLMPATPSAVSPQAEAETLSEINKDTLVLRDDGVVFTDPPMMRGVPLAKISPDHPYWEPDWKPIEEIVEPIRLKHQERYEQLEQSGTTHRDKHLANRDAKRGRTILKFLEDGELHPYQLVGKQWINYRITNYDALFRLAQLLTEELPRMNLDIKPSEWLRQRLHELYLEKGDKFDVASWIGKAYHDSKIEALRAKNGFARVGRPPAHATRDTEPGSSSKKASAPRSLKRKDPHQTPESTPSKPRAATIKASPSAASESAAAAAAGLPKPKKIKIITSQPQPQPQPASGEPASAKNPKIILNSPFPPSATAEQPPTAAEEKKETEDDAASEEQQSPLDYDGYTSTDSMSQDPLHPNDWRLHQVKTRTFATNPAVTQYWHWVTEEKDPRKKNMIEHQVLAETKNKWQVFKKPYNFHLRLTDMAEVSFARDSFKVIVTHKKGRDGRDLAQRGDVMAQFKRHRTKKRFLTFLSREKGIKVAEVPRYVSLCFLLCAVWMCTDGPDREFMELKWNALNPETLPGPDSD